MHSVNSGSQGPPQQDSIAIVIPVLNEALHIGSALQRLREDFPDCELVVVDGGSTDGTPDIARAYASVVNSEPGRARQMNAGAKACFSEVLWFIHVDTEVDPLARTQIRSALRDREVVGGGLSLRFDARSVGLNYLSWSSNLRARYLHWIFGDQAMFMRRSTFDALGGFPDLPILEDMEMSRRLHRVGKLSILPATTTASARRFVEHGTWPMIIFMQYLKVLYFLRVDPEKIRVLYTLGPSTAWNFRQSTSGPNDGLFSFSKRAHKGTSTGTPRVVRIKGRIQMGGKHESS